MCVFVCKDLSIFATFFFKYDNWNFYLFYYFVIETQTFHKILF